MPRKVFKKKLIRRRPTFRRKSRAKVAKAVKRYVRRTETNHLTTVCLRRGPDQLFPDRMCAKMKNEFAFSLTGAAGAVNAYCWCANGLHLPLGSVQSGAVTLSTGNATTIYGLGNILSADSSSGATGPYNYYRIISTGVVINVQNTSTASSDSATMTLFPLDGNTLGSLGNVNAFLPGPFVEYPYSKYTTVAGTTMNKGVWMRHAMSTARLYGYKYKSSLEDVGFSATYNANPTNIWYWVLAWFPQTSNNTTAVVTVKMEYWIEFFNRNNLPVTST